MPKIIPSSGPSYSPLMVVGEAPGAHEDALEENFVGPTGRLLDEMLSVAGIRLHECYKANVIRVRPPANKIRRLSEYNFTVDQWEKELWDEIDAINPNCILALGNIALKALTGEVGIQKWRGSILLAKNGRTKVVPTIHVAALLHKSEDDTSDYDADVMHYSARYYIQNDINRAVEESANPKLELPERLLQVAKNSLDVYRFLDTYKGHKRVAGDIEVINAVPHCVSLAFSSSHSMSIPLMNVDDRIAQISETEFFEIYKMLDEFFSTPGLEIVGQNWKFDQDKLEAVCNFRLPSPFMDTMMANHTIWPELPQSLAFQTSCLTREPYYKDEYKEYNAKKDNINKIYLYNAKDSAVDFEIHLEQIKILEERGLTQFFFDYVMKLHDLYLDMEREGFDLDVEKRKELNEKYCLMFLEHQTGLEKLIGREINVSSNPQIINLLYRELKFPERKKQGRLSAGEDILTALLANNAKTDERRKILEYILSIRQIKKTLGTYIRFLEDDDGRIRTSYRITGTETGRSSTSLLNAPLRPTTYIKYKGQAKKKKGIGLAFQTITKHGDVGSDIRSMFIADPGTCFLNVDLSQADARVVALLACDNYVLDLFTRKIDLHRITAGWFFISPRCTEEEALRLIPKKTPDGKDEPRRFIGKAGRHLGNYDGGKKRLMQTINTDARKYHIDVNISEWKAGQILDIFHAKSPNIRGVFHQEIRDTLESDGKMLVNAYGRQRQFLDRWGENMFREAYAYIPSSTVIDHLRQAMLEARKRKIIIVGESHDAFTMRVKPDEAKDIAKEVKGWLERPIDFSRCSLVRDSLIIPCEFEQGINYKDLEKLDV